MKKNILLISIRVKVCQLLLLKKMYLVAMDLVFGFKFLVCIICLVHTLKWNRSYECLTWGEKYFKIKGPSNKICASGLTKLDSSCTRLDLHFVDAKIPAYKKVFVNLSFLSQQPVHYSSVRSSSNA